MFSKKSWEFYVSETVSLTTPFWASVFGGIGSAWDKPCANSLCVNDCGIGDTWVVSEMQYCRACRQSFLLIWIYSARMARSSAVSQSCFGYTNNTNIFFSGWFQRFSDFATNKKFSTDCLKIFFDSSQTNFQLSTNGLPLIGRLYVAL